MGTTSEEVTAAVNPNPWRVSSFSDGSQHVEVQAIDGGGMNVRDSNDPDGGILTFNAAEVDAFLKGAKAGEFDDLT